MKDFVSHHRIAAAASTLSVAMLGWALLVVPGGAAWTRTVWLAALAGLLVTGVTVLFGVMRTPSMAQVIRGVEHEPAVSAPGTPRRRR